MATVWGSDDVHCLIALFRSSEVLWRANHKEYGKRGARFQTLKKISVELGGSSVDGISLVIMLFVNVAPMPC